MKKLLAVALVVGMFLPVMSGAQEKKGKSPEERFASLDKNNDKKLSEEEFLATVPDDKKEKGKSRFAMADKNNDKFLSLEEYKEIPQGKKKN
jgi:hypothetical protein